MLALVNTLGNGSPVDLREVGRREPAPNEAVVEVRAFCLNREELALMGSRPEGWRPGQDVAGVVVRGAADGTGPSEGERVVGLVEGGGWSERVAVSTERLAVLPEGVGIEEAATLPVAGTNALRILRLGGPRSASACSSRGRQAAWGASPCSSRPAPARWSAAW